ncbi:hypothetical protein LZC95_19805 [Pendulispora brunnea]|uniref:Uncharacterized protein n=1 Tax=Pendulispora brunnea TaxID=2905690 RepID=A0ABZ2KPW9_9BACT
MNPSLKVTVAEEVLDEFGVIGHELRLAIARWKDVCRELWSWAPTERRTRLIEERERLVFRISRMVECYRRCAVDIRRDLRGHIANDVWNRTDEAFAVPNKDYFLATVIRMRGDDTGEGTPALHEWRMFMYGPARRVADGG